VITYTLQHTLAQESSRRVIHEVLHVSNVQYIWVTYTLQHTSAQNSSASVVHEWYYTCQKCPAFEYDKRVIYTLQHTSAQKSFWRAVLELFHIWDVIYIVCRPCRAFLFAAAWPRPGWPKCSTYKCAIAHARTHTHAKHSYSARPFLRANTYTFGAVGFWHGPTVCNSTTTLLFWQPPSFAIF